MILAAFTRYRILDYSDYDPKTGRNIESYSDFISFDSEYDLESEIEGLEWFYRIPDWGASTEKSPSQIPKLKRLNIFEIKSWIRSFQRVGGNFRDHLIPRGNYKFPWD